MRRGAPILLLAFALVFPLGARAQSPLITSVEKVADGVWMAQTSKGSNAGWFLIGETVVAVDTGSDAATGSALLEKIQETAGKPVRFVVITHAHGDHAGGVGPFVAAGAEVICQENAAPGIATLAASSSKTRGGILALSDRLGFYGGPRRAAVYFLGAGHSAGDLFLFLPDDKVLFSGDLALVGRIPYMESPDVDPQGWENVLGRLAQLDIDKVVPGHGKLGTRQALADTYAYVKKVNDLTHMLLTEQVPEDLIEAWLRRPNSGIEPTEITPEILLNIRAVLKTARAKATAKPTPTPRPAAKAPVKKK